jgi:dTMP kinase
MPPFPPRNGRFVTLEGPEGSGKTVIARRLVASLEARGTAALLTREPGGTRLGERLRAILLASEAETLSARTDALLFNAARAQLVGEVIAPALDAGEVVICARFADSTLAYQGYGAGVPLADLRAIADVATAGLEPDLTVLLDVDPALGRRRRTAGDAAEDRLESEADEFHGRIRTAFLELAAGRPEQYLVLPAHLPVDELAARILERVESLLSLSRGVTA